MQKQIPVSEIPEDQVEETVENQPDMLTTALVTSDIALWDWRRDRSEVFLNASYYMMLGYEPFEKEQSNAVGIDYVHAGDADRLRTLWQEIRRQKIEYIDFEFRALKKDSGYAWCRLRGRTVEYSPEGLSARIIGTITEVTEKKHWQETLKETLRRHETLLDSLPGMAYRCPFANGEWSMEFVSEGCIELTGFTPAELTENRENYSNLIHPEDRDYVWSEVDKAVGQKQRFEMIYRIKTVSGENKWVWERGTGVFSESGGFLAIEGFTTDITVYQKLHQDLKNENIRLKSLMHGQDRFGRLIGKSPAMQTVYDLILQAAASCASVTINGESGTGKELVARAIHDLSDRRERNFVSVNCGAIPDNLIESEFFGYTKGAFTGAESDKSGYLDRAAGGTLFLDEIGEIHPNMQVKLLRALDGGGYTPVGGKQVKRPDLRIICATNRNLEEMVSAGTMRKDFFYRIHIIPIVLPPLRERKEDIPLLIFAFLEQFGGSTEAFAHIPGNIMRAVYEYDWPGNVRELQNMVQRYLTLKKDDFLKTRPFQGLLQGGTDAGQQGGLSEDLSLKNAVRAFEKQHIEAVLARQDGNRTHAARYLGIGLRSLQRKIREYGIR